MEDGLEESVAFTRVCAVDIGKAAVVACVRVPHEVRPDRRVQQVREFTTMHRDLLALADWLQQQRIEVVAMEATGDYWKPVFYLLEAEGFTCWLLNARQVKNAPGRPKTDRLDAVWLAKVLEKGMCRPSLVHPKPIRQLRDLTRYRRSLVREQVREKQRIEKLLEDAQVKLDTVLSQVLGVSGRRMLQALIDGQHDPAVLAEMACQTARKKIPQIRESLTGHHFEAHHAFLCAAMLAHIDALTAQIAELDTRIGQLTLPFAAILERLDEIPGIAGRGAQELLAEIGPVAEPFPAAPHLVSWAKFAPIDRNSAGRKKGGTTGKGNPWLAATIGEAVAGGQHTPSFLSARYRRLARRRGTKRAIVAVGNSLLTIIWHLLDDPDSRYHDLGADFYERRHTTRRQHQLIRELQHLTGQHVTLTPAAG
jgi:transposase